MRIRDFCIHRTLPSGHGRSLRREVWVYARTSGILELLLKNLADYWRPNSIGRLIYQTHV